MPWLAPMLSVKTSAITEIPAEKRSPVMMEGMARGTTTRRISCHPSTPKLRAASTTRRSTLRTPLKVLRYMGNKVASAIRYTWDASPTPNQTMNKKISAG